MSAVACMYYYISCCLLLLHYNTYLALWGFFLPAGDSWTKIVLFIPFCCNQLRMSTQGTINREYSKLTAKGAILLPGKQDFMVYFGMFEILMFFEKFLIDWDLGCALSEIQKKTHLLLYKLRFFKLRCLSLFFEMYTSAWAAQRNARILFT